MSLRGIEILAVAGLATVQDRGRPGHMHEGVPPGGPLVPELYARASRSVSNAPDAAAIEVFGSIAFAARGGAVVVAIDDAAPFTCADGARVDVPLHPSHRVRYVAFGGGLDVPRVLGARATLLASGLGGHEGRPLRRGDRVPLGAPSPPPDPDARRAPASALDLDTPIAVILGPDGARFTGEARRALERGTFYVSPASDRTGTRLVGPAMPHSEAAPSGGGVSTPMVAGAIEVPSSGAPIVLGPDHPTTGGYPVIGAVARFDLGRFAARKIGAPVRFRILSFPHAPLP